MNRETETESVLSSSRNHRRRSSRRYNRIPSSRIRRLNRTSTPISSPLASHRSALQVLNRSRNHDQPSSIVVDNNESDTTSSACISPTNVPDTDVSTASPRPFDVTLEMENIENSNTSTTTRSGKLRKNTILSYFRLQADESYQCNLCQSVSFHF